MWFVGKAGITVRNQKSSFLIRNALSSTLSSYADWKLGIATLAVSEYASLCSKLTTTNKLDVGISELTRRVATVVCAHKPNKLASYSNTDDTVWENMQKKQTRIILTYEIH